MIEQSRARFVFGEEALGFTANQITSDWPFVFPG